MQILVTGANGFIGQHLCQMLLERGHQVTATIRQEIAPNLPEAVTCIKIGDLTTDEFLNDTISDVDTIIHLAARTHIMRETEPCPKTAYHSINVEASRRLANQAVALNVNHLIFMSSIKVNGERTIQMSFSNTDPPAPEDHYGRTKWSAELELQRITSGTKTNLSIIRAPLVYGPGVKGNFHKLMRAVAKGKFLPLGQIRNKRSFCYVKNLCDALIILLDHPEPSGKVYLVRDGEDLSTTTLVQRIAQALNVRPKLFHIPIPLFRFAGRILRRRSAVSRLTDSLQINDEPIRKTLGWSPPYTVDQGLEETATWFKSRCRNSEFQLKETKTHDVS